MSTTHTTFTVTLPRPDADALAEIAATHPALTVHAVHLVAVRVGLRAMLADPAVLVTELQQIADQRRAAKQAGAK